jgi:aspartyl-tRNA(Asn)/glutamyl-tRNA(Gln) amidotransferase subunit A
MPRFVTDAVSAAAKALQAAGAEVVEVSPQWPCYPYDPFMVFWEATYAGMMATAYRPEKCARMDPDLRAIAERGSQIDIATYHRALSQRLSLTAAAEVLFSEVDLLVGSVMPCSPPWNSREAPEGFVAGDWRWCPFTYIWNMTNQPAASVPWGWDELSLPVGVQIVGRRGGEADVIRGSRIVEAAGAGCSRANRQLGDCGEVVD